MYKEEYYYILIDEIIIKPAKVNFVYENTTSALHSILLCQCQLLSVASKNQDQDDSLVH